MFSPKERLKAIELFLKYDCSYAVTVRELGYPSVNALRRWYKEYLDSGTVKLGRRRRSKYSEEQQQYAGDYYLEHGQCYSRTIRILGYSSRHLLRQWCEERTPKARKPPILERISHCICLWTIKLTAKIYF